jgi:hypothetical protein
MSEALDRMLQAVDPPGTNRVPVDYESHIVLYDHRWQCRVPSATSIQVGLATASYHRGTVAADG